MAACLPQRTAAAALHTRVAEMAGTHAAVQLCPGTPAHPLRRCLRPCCPQVTAVVVNGPGTVIEISAVSNAEELTTGYL